MLHKTLFQSYIKPAVFGAASRRTIVVSPPTEKVSKMELYLSWTFIVGATLFTPAWVLLHIREYRGSK